MRLETERRKQAEAALKESEKQYRQLQTKSAQQQRNLRHLSHQILRAQEEERRHISRELHDEISQILTGINVRLAELTLEAAANTTGLKRKILRAQRMVEKSVTVVHRFARDLRPAMLDDLGLIPAMLTFMKELGRRSGLRIQFVSVEAEEIREMDSLKRTVLYRVAQEALTNIVKHAKASRAEVRLQLVDGVVILEINDNGTSFDVDRVLESKRQKRLGILGMRERVEMVGGTFTIESTPGNGTTVYARVPLRNGANGVLG